MNPLFDRKLFVPDGEAHVMPDGRLYVYGSLDIGGAQTYCSDRYHVLSTDDPRLERWVDHGVSFRADAAHLGGMARPGMSLYAPDAACINGKYCLFFCTDGGGEGVAFSDGPAGPFTDAHPIAGADGDGIDPAVFADDDGSVYYFWGQFRLRGARLKPDLSGIEPETLQPCLLSDEEHSFHEGSSLRKYNGKYYLLYTSVERGSAHCLSYAVADAPLGPYRKGGVVIDNTGCDPASWNDHGSIECFGGQWYVFYHRSSQNGIFSRRMCAEPIFFDENGGIREVSMTTGGGSGAVDARTLLDGGRACRMSDAVCILPDAGGVEQLTWGRPVHGGGWPRWAQFGPLCFDEALCRVTVWAKGSGTLQLCVEGMQPLAELPVDSADFVPVTVPCAPVTGVHSLWVRFAGDSLAVRSLQFTE